MTGREINNAVNIGHYVLPAMPRANTPTLIGTITRLQLHEIELVLLKRKRAVSNLKSSKDLGC